MDVYRKKTVNLEKDINLWKPYLTEGKPYAWEDGVVIKPTKLKTT